MTAKIAARTAQWPLAAEFTFNFDDTMKDTAGVTRDFGSLAGGSSAATFYAFEPIPLPVGATVIGGHVVTDTAFDTAGYDVKVGDSASVDRYLGSTDKKGTGLTELVPTGYVGVGENLRVSVSTDDACTTGKMTVRVLYTIANRANENTIN
jgi:hypothetical protein